MELPGRVLKAIGTIASKDKDRIALNFVHIKPVGDKTIIEATNGHAACRLTVDQKFGYERFISRHVISLIRPKMKLVFEETGIEIEGCAFAYADPADVGHFYDIGKVLMLPDDATEISNTRLMSVNLLPVIKLINDLAPSNQYGGEFRFWKYDLQRSTPMEQLRITSKTEYGDLQILIMASSR